MSQSQTNPSQPRSRITPFQNRHIAILTYVNETSEGRTPGLNPVRAGAQSFFFKSPNLGQPSHTELREGSVDPSLAGKYLGYGTYVNANQNMFKTVKRVTMIRAITDRLNERLQAHTPTLEFVQRIPSIANAATGITPDIIAGANVYSIGLAGMTAGAGNTRTSNRYTNIDQYYPDDRAKINFLEVEQNNKDFAASVDVFALPGSSASIVANAYGFPLGQVSVKNPYKDNGYFNLGSPGYVTTLRNIAKNSSVVDNNNDIDLNHLVGQGAVYGLGPIYQRYRVVVTAQPINAQDTQTPYRYKVANVGNLIKNEEFLQEIERYYQLTLKSSNRQKVGRMGQASLKLRLIDYFQNQNGEPLNPQDVLNQFGATGSTEGVSRWNAPFARNTDRRGLTRFAMRDENGPIPQSRSWQSNGECSIRDSGPGIVQNSSGSEYGLTSRRSVRHKTGDPTYRCVTSADRNNNIFNLNKYGPAAPRMDGLNMQDIIAGTSTLGLTAQGIHSKYLDQALHPTRYGISPYLTGRGVGINAFNIINNKNAMTEDEQYLFNQSNLPMSQNIIESRRIADELLRSPQTAGIRPTTKGYQPELQARTQTGARMGR